MFLLTPLKESYYDLDKLTPELTFSLLCTMIIGSGIKALFLFFVAPLLVFGRVMQALEHAMGDGKRRKAVERDPTFNYGALQTIRQLGAGTNWRVYFQKLDKEMDSKLLQQQLLDTIVDFLDERGIDTSAIKERSVHILNNGVIVSGGSVSADGMAVGQGAQAKVVNALRRNVPAAA